MNNPYSQVTLLVPKDKKGVTHYSHRDGLRPLRLFCQRHSGKVLAGDFFEVILDQPWYEVRLNPNAGGPTCKRCFDSWRTAYVGGLYSAAEDAREALVRLAKEAADVLGQGHPLAGSILDRLDTIEAYEEEVKRR
jgi:hypothetical protein